jgi:hypothetical protein
MEIAHLWQEAALRWFGVGREYVDKSMAMHCRNAQREIVFFWTYSNLDCLWIGTVSFWT